MRNAAIAKPDSCKLFAVGWQPPRVSWAELFSPEKLRNRLIAFDSLPISITFSLVDDRLAADDNESIRMASSDNAEPLI